MYCYISKEMSSLYFGPDASCRFEARPQALPPCTLPLPPSCFTGQRFLVKFMRLLPQKGRLHQVRPLYRFGILLILSQPWKMEVYAPPIIPNYILRSAKFWLNSYTKDVRETDQPFRIFCARK
jgi:hypothetical protein